MDIRGKTALVTGASSGIGRALALAEAGAARVILVAQEPLPLHETAQVVRDAGAEAVVHACDLTNPVAVADLFARPEATKLDILCNNAGCVSGEPGFPDTPDEVVLRVVALNYTAVVLGLQAAVRIMRAHGRGGAVVNTASITALTPSLRNPVYAGAKAGVLMLTRSCAGLWDTDRISVNAVCPAIVRTGMAATTGTNGPASWMLEAMEAVEVLEPEVPARVAIDLIRDDARHGEYVVIENPPKLG